jgi:hypothetical protein
MSFVLTFSLSFVIVLAVIAGMAIGVLNGRRAIRGSCGGLNGATGCGLCGERCEEQARFETADSSLAESYSSREAGGER